MIMKRRSLRTRSAFRNTSASGWQSETQQGTSETVTGFYKRTPRGASCYSVVPVENEQPAQQAIERVSAGSRYSEHKKRLFVQISLKQPYNILTGLCNMEELQLRGLMLQ